MEIKKDFEKIVLKDVKVGYKIFDGEKNPQRKSAYLLLNDEQKELLESKYAECFKERPKFSSLAITKGENDKGEQYNDWSLSIKFFEKTPIVDIKKQTKSFESLKGATVNIVMKPFYWLSDQSTYKNGGYSMSVSAFQIIKEAETEDLSDFEFEEGDDIEDFI